MGRAGWLDDGLESDAEMPDSGFFGRPPFPSQASCSSQVALGEKGFQSFGRTFENVKFKEKLGMAWLFI